MGQRVGLLAGQDKTAHLRAAQVRLLVPVTDLVTFLLGHQFGGAMQGAVRPRSSHGCGEAVLAASVLAESDQIGRTDDRPHDFVNCSRPSLLPVRKFRQVRAA